MHTIPCRLQRLGRAAMAFASIVILGAATFAPPRAEAAQTGAPCDAPGASQTGPRLHVTVSGARRVAGNITFTLYGEERARFLVHHGWLARTRVALTGTAAEGCFVVSAPGAYAVAVFHDENDNHRFDRTLLGMPLEGYGFSNDAPTTLGLPSFDAVRFTVNAGDTNIAVHLRY